MRGESAEWFQRLRSDLVDLLSRRCRNHLHDRLDGVSGAVIGAVRSHQGSDEKGNHEIAAGVLNQGAQTATQRFITDLPGGTSHTDSRRGEVADLGSSGRNGEVLHEGHLPESGTPLYRGIARLLSDGTVNPQYTEALSGVVKPRGAVDLTPDEHITQINAENSDTTSWSRSRSTAAVFTDADGVIVEWRTGRPPLGASWRFKPILDIEGDLSQVLIQGTLAGARAVRYVAPGSASAPYPPA